MGGATSKLEATQWWNADGKLPGAAANPNQKLEHHRTISPSEEPTDRLQLFDLIKHLSLTSQRDFRVRDGNETIYVTRSVPGTLAWFDVCKPKPKSSSPEDETDDLKLSPSVSIDKSIPEEGEDDKEDNGDNEEEEEELEPLLRVQVDSGRRTWIVYNYNTPIFEGQAPADLGDQRKALGESDHLYKACSITVSWNLTGALATRYGPPSKIQDFMIDDLSTLVSSDRQSTVSEADIFRQAKGIADRHRRGEDANAGLDDSMTGFGDFDETKSTEEDPAVVPKIRTKSIKETAPSDNPGLGGETTLDPPPPPSGGMMDMLNQSMGMFKFHFENTPKILTKKERQEQAQKQSLEGVVNLDAPMLLCQKVYNKSGANYQTGLVDSKEQVVKLWRLDDASKNGKSSTYTDTDDDDDSDHHDLHESDPLAKAVAYEREIGHSSGEEEGIEAIRKWWLESYMDGDRAAFARFFGMEVSGDASKRNSSWTKFLPRQLSKKGFNLDNGDEDEETKDAEAEESPSEKTTGDKEEEPIETSEEKEEEEEDSKPKVYGSNAGVVQGTNLEDPDREEPLVAYWAWKNTLRSHKLQMHLAKNSDLALHVILAIISNILRFERGGFFG